jgi:hypothetical protein
LTYGERHNTARPGGLNHPQDTENWQKTKKDTISMEQTEEFIETKGVSKLGRQKQTGF